MIKDAVVKVTTCGSSCPHYDDTKYPSCLLANRILEDYEVTAATMDRYPGWCPLPNSVLQPMGKGTKYMFIVDVEVDYPASRHNLLGMTNNIAEALVRQANEAFLADRNSCGLSLSVTVIEPSSKYSVQRRIR